jgi:hypothetical protein
MPVSQKQQQDAAKVQRHGFFIKTLTKIRPKDRINCIFRLQHIFAVQVE